MALEIYNSQHEDWHQENGRQQAAGILNSRLRRQFLTLFAVPELNPERLKGYAGLHGRPLDPEHPIVDHRIVKIGTFADQPAWRSQQGEIETTVLLQVGYLDKHGQPAVGGSRQHHRRMVDFSLEPRHPQQGVELLMKGRGPLLSKLAGQLVIRRDGEWVDVYVGLLSNQQPARQYRLAHKLFRGDRPLVSLAEGLMLPGKNEELIVGDIKEGEVLLTLNIEVDYWSYQLCDMAQDHQAMADQRRLSGSEHELFDVLNLINRDQTSYALQEAGLPVLPEQGRGVFGALVLFPRKVAEQLLHEPQLGYDPPAVLKGSFHEAVGPSCPVEDRFHLRSNLTGTLSSDPYSLPGQEHLIEIVTTTGGRQILPATAVLFKYLADRSAKGLEKGDEIKRGEVIGDCCPRRTYSREQLTSLLGINYAGLLQEFLLSSAVYPGEHGWDGDGVLLDSKYVTAVLEHAVQDKYGDPIWFWDFRNCTDYFNGCVICAATRYFDWDQDTVHINGIVFKLGEPQHGVPTWSALVKTVPAQVPVPTAIKVAPQPELTKKKFKKRKYKQPMETVVEESPLPPSAEPKSAVQRLVALEDLRWVEMV